jgi:hypothetical protein
MEKEELPPSAHYEGTAKSQWVTSFMNILGNDGKDSEAAH